MIFKIPKWFLALWIVKLKYCCGLENQIIPVKGVKCKIFKNVSTFIIQFIILKLSRTLFLLKVNTFLLIEGFNEARDYWRLSKHLIVILDPNCSQIPDLGLVTRLGLNCVSILTNVTHAEAEAGCEASNMSLWSGHSRSSDQVSSQLMINKTKYFRLWPSIEVSTLEREL